jgi:DHA1 family bicyclomycin/chloramphenicol resistance-like MFS transporter
VRRWSAFIGHRGAVPLSDQRSWALAALLASLSMLGPFAIDMYLPAFAAIAAEFDASPIAVQQTLSAYLFAYAFMMLWHGSLSDALGRRPVILGGLAIYSLASLGCAIAGNIESLWLFRTLQGLSAGAGLVVGRAVIRDRFQGPEAQRLMSQTTLVFGIAPALAPVVGGALLNVSGWRAIFWMMLAFSVGVCAWAAARLPETLPRAQRQPLHARVLWHNYRTVLLRLDFLLLAAIPTLNFAAFFIYIASAPAFLAQLGVSTWGFAWLFVPMITGVMLGATISGRTAGRLSAQQAVGLGYACMFAGAGIELVVAAFVAPAVPWHVLPIAVFTLGSSVAMPSLTLLLLDLFPTMRGLASSLQGFVQFAFSGLVAGTIAPLLARSLLALAGGMLAFAGASCAVWIAYRRGAHTLLRS